MELLKLDGIVLRAVDFNERDRILTIFTAQRGKVTVTAKGCNSIKSKLSAVAKPRCMATFEVNVGRGGRYTLVGYSLTDMFYSLSSDLDKYYVSEIMLEYFDKTTAENSPEPTLFVDFINYYKRLCYTEQPPLALLCNFAYWLLSVNGLLTKKIDSAEEGEVRLRGNEIAVIRRMALLLEENLGVRCNSLAEYFKYLQVN